MQIGYFMGVLSKYGFIYNLEHKCQSGRKARTFPRPSRERLCESKVRDNIALFDSLLFSISLNAQV